MEDKILGRKISRRDVLKTGTGVAAATAAASLGFPLPTRAQEAYEDPNTAFEYPRMETGALLSRILSSQVGSKIRHDLEDEYCYRIRNKEDVDLGFSTVSSPDLRQQLLLKRWGLRENGKLPKLSKENVEWAKKRRMYPETLAVCVDAYQKAKEVIAKLANTKSFEQVKENIRQVGLDGVMINPGGMAELVCTETGSLEEDSLATTNTAPEIRYGFMNTGEYPAIYQINDKHKYFTEEKKNLALLSQKLSRDLGYTYYPENIQGSARGDIEKNLSGGAIGLQFMPGNALKIYELMEKVGEKFNPFDPESSVVGAWIFLALNGYKRGDSASQFKAIKGWNQDREQIETVFYAANDYYDQVIKIKQVSV